MNRVRLPAGVLAGALALGALTGCGGQAGEGSSGALDLRVCIASEPATLDPAKNSTLDGAILAQHLFGPSWGRARPRAMKRRSTTTAPSPIPSPCGRT